ncbi:hypothetical protein B0H14DRAFT_3668009 [Mycena olivaceomarginata]|nr:hypothetical protein B0H14DRAFT_3668009 [Mycena olivaceomarginata]
MASSIPPKSLREQADDLKSQFQPMLHQRKPRDKIPGASSFSAAEQAVASAQGNQSVGKYPQTPLYAPGIQSLPYLTPQSLPHSNSRAQAPPHMIRPPSPLALFTVTNDDPFIASELPETLPDSRPDESNSESLPRREMIGAYSRIHGILLELKKNHISPVDVLIQALNPEDLSYDRYRGNLSHDDSTKLTRLLDTIMSDPNGRKLMSSMRPHVEEFACEIVAEEMETRRRNSMLPGIAVFTPDFIEKWALDEDKDHSPFLTIILTTASQTERAKKYNKLKNPDKLVQVVTPQLLYQSSNRCMSFQAQFGLFLWSTGSARQTIDAAFRCGLSVSYDSVLNLGQSLGLGCTMDNTLFVATEPHDLGYDNLNISTSIFVEQRGASGPAKVTSGTFGVLYGLRNANFDDMLIAPIMRRLSASTGIFHDQLLITVIETLLIYNEGFEDVAKHPSLQHQPIRAIPVGYRTPQFATRASTIEEATVRGNLQYHDELYVTQLKRTPEEMSKYAIPSFNDQLTNARIRGAQLLRSKDVNAWARRDIFQLGFGLFHLCLNLVWAILHTYRGSINELGSLAYFFALMEKKLLSNDQPDYHSLVAALTQILHGLLLNAWSRECRFSSFKLFADSKPNPATLRNIALRILNN